MDIRGRDRTWRCYLVNGNTSSISSPPPATTNSAGKQTPLFSSKTTIMSSRYIWARNEENGRTLQSGQTNGGHQLDGECAQAPVNRVEELEINPI
ncbi:hypothetical protein CHS0354_023497 [Potamilus streckersoni]|uniref:Uncharacterized protein n=1 Tax=Potamilus streckersoni TaxID=2493646 RepID=A0AAE0S7P8_9BIVA|nr:hypothetical protein CHS0354_023497 [Potamilus streckersoni]